jgi:glutamate/tyrosine decarboxylase-like PLP-dependent enzyme
LLLPKAFTAGAAYLPAPDDPRPNLGYHSPEMSRRARSLAVWATLRAYGRSGYRAMVERHLALARTLGEVVETAPDFDLLAPVQLNIVCFRYAPPSQAGDEDALNRLNRSLGQAVLDDGRVYVGTTTYDGRVAFRPAIVNWRTTEPDVRLVVDVIRELGERAIAG